MNNNIKTDKDNYLTISVIFKVEGVVKNEKLSYSRGRDSYVFSFEDFLFHASIIETFNGNGSTYLDDLIDEYADKFEVKEDEKERLLNKYWHKKKETLNDVLKQYKLQSWDKIFDTEKMFIQFQMYNIYDHFCRLPSEIQKGFLYLIKQDDLLDIDKSINDCPQFMKDYAQDMILKE